MVRNRIKRRNSLLMPPTTLGAPALELGNRAATSGAKQQDSTAIRRGHLPELGPKALVVGVRLGASLPRQPIDLFRGGGLDGVLILQFQIELHGLLQALASRLIALARSGAAAKADEEDGEAEEGDEADYVRELEVEAVEGGGGGEEERE
ncbi:hypothetical protein PanWU01x14_006340 [Parasponia andersonii]|uniref:Uncharacterized protein n=1 Tax=Parasponia andersonii TaxID=3476 RepID=A0A2P5E3R7_PARAD|nr:hypothetical protein PanWU01x14_006340 [Parasponia andersonii]